LHRPHLCLRSLNFGRMFWLKEKKYNGYTNSYARSITDDDGRQFGQMVEV
jgi:hypothetical protein